jgi:hypothetical protein
MITLGVAVEMTKPKRPTAWMVLLDDGGQTPVGDDISGVTVLEQFAFTSADEPYPSILAMFASNLRVRLRDRAVDAVTVRRADKPQRPNNTDGPRYRLLAEGALAGAAREIVPATSLRTGADIGQAWGGSKAGTDTLGAQIATDPKYAEAAAAALAALRNP